MMPPPSPTASSTSVATASSGPAQQDVSALHAAAALSTTDLQPPARVGLTPEVAQHSPYLIRGKSSGSQSSVSVSRDEQGASTSTPSLFAFFSQLALHNGHGSKQRANPHAHQEGVESGGMSDEDFSDSSDTEESGSSAPEGRCTPASAVTGEGEEEGDLAPLPDQAMIDKHHVFHPPAPPTDGALHMSTRLAQLAVSNLASQSSHDAGAAKDEPKIDDGWTDNDKLAAINEEFGDFKEHFAAGAAHGAEEKYIAEATGGLFRGILIIGSLHLTSHRLTFLARLPPVSQQTLLSGSLLKAGAVYVLKQRTRLGVTRTTKKRVWLELSADMATTYPNSSDAGRTRPIKTILLSSIRRIRDEKEERVIEVELYTPSGVPSDVRRMEFDTRESCLAWRREFEAALFHFDRQRRLLARQKPKPGPIDKEAEAEEADREADWERVRVSLPLVRIGCEQVSDYMGFASILDLEVNNESAKTFAARSFAPTEGSHDTPSPSSFSAATGTALEQTTDKPPSRIHVQFALLSSQQSFIAAFERARAEALQMCQKCGASKAECLPPLIDLEDAFRDYLRRGEDGGEIDLDGPEVGAGEDVGEQTLRTVFGLGNTDGLWSTTCGLQRGLVPLKGQLVVSQQYIGFYRRAYAGSDVKVRFNIADVKSATKWSTPHLSTKGLALHIHGHPDVHLEFFSKQNRDDSIVHVNDAVATYAIYHPSVSRADSGLVDVAPPSPVRTSFDSALPPGSTLGTQLSTTPSTSTPELTDLAESEAASSASQPGHQRQSSRADDILTASFRRPTQEQPKFTDETFNYVPRVVNLPQEVSERTGKRVAPRHFCMLTIGSRGDVEPYIALSLGLMREGHRCTIITHDEFQEWVEGFNIGFRQAGGDPAALMKLSVAHTMFSPAWFRASLGGFRKWLDDLFHDAWVACHDADVLIESPSAMAGIHIAEALKIPYFRAFTMPWTRTHEYPHAFMVPQIEMSGNFYYSTFLLFDNVIWKATAGQVNRWRRKELGLGPTDMSHLEQEKVPFVYNFSSAVVPMPLDWTDRIMISGYWFKPEETEWTPPPALDAFMQRARADGKPLVYIGFGSIVVPHPAETTKAIIRAVERADVRAIVAKGWSGRGNEVDKDGLPIEVPFPNSCYSLEKVPHDWLFKQIDAAVHHGGAGTTGASLRAGLPTIIKPFFGDQYFWALRVQKLGVGARVGSLAGNELSDALIKATTDALMREKAAKVGEKIRAERGVEKTIEWLYQYLERARDRHQSSQRRSGSPAPRLACSSPTLGPLPSNTSSPSGSPPGGSKVLPGLSSMSALGGKGIKTFKEAGSAVVSVGRLGSALKGKSKGAGTGSGA